LKHDNTHQLVLLLYFRISLSYDIGAS